jgi:DNA processing protein
MSGHDERLARIALGQLCEPGDLKIAGLAAELGAVELHHVLTNDRGPGDVLTDIAGRLAALDPERDLDRASRMGIRFVIPSDPEWPTSVDDLESAEPLQRVGRAPLGLWVKGPRRLDQIAGAVAIVGSRSATTYGGDVAATIAAEVAHAGRWVVSGAAFGIDQAGHRGALAAGGATVAVLACGVDRAYPAAHKDLLDHLAHEGAVVSEVAPGRAPTRLRFLARNRLIAALATGTVVVEAAGRSGALNTANWATRLNRALMGVPGPVTSAQSEGVHELIRNGSATLVTTGKDVLEMVGEAGAHLVEPPRGPERPRDHLTRRHQQVLEAVPLSAPARADAIARTAGMGLVEVRSTLGALEDKGLVVLGEDGWRLAEGAQV